MRSILLWCILLLIGGSLAEELTTAKNEVSQDKPSIQVASIDDDGKKTEAVAKANVTKTQDKKATGPEGVTNESDEQSKKTEDHVISDKNETGYCDEYLNFGKTFL